TRRARGQGRRQDRGHRAPGGIPDHRTRRGGRPVPWLGTGAGRQTDRVSGPGPRGDADVDGWARDLGLPGIVDVHTHLRPPRMMRSVCACVGRAGRLVGREWPIAYKWPEAERVAHLAAMGVRLFSALAYAHRPDMAADLNDWTLEFAAATPGCLPSMTF